MAVKYIWFVIQIKYLMCNTRRMGIWIADFMDKNFIIVLLAKVTTAYFYLYYLSRILVSNMDTFYITLVCLTPLNIWQF